MTPIELITIVLLCAYGFLTLFMVFGPFTKSEKALKLLAGVLVILVLINIITLIKTYSNGR